MWRVAALALPLLGAAPAAADGPRRARVLFVPPPADAPADLRELAGAIAGRLRRSPSLALIHEDRLRGALALAPARPAAGELRQTVDAALGRVEDAYRRLAVDEAVQALQELENARLNALACPESIGLAAQISFWLGIVLAASAETDRASERFRVALFVDPHRPIDAAYFPPQTVALFERVRARLAAAPTGSLSIATDPDAAEVYLDGRRAGVAPLTATASEGDHFVCVRRVGSRDWAARLRVFAGRVETQRIFLPRAAPGEIAAQLAGLLASPGSLDLGSAAHVEAMAAAVGADVVARAVLPAAIEYRAVGPRAAVDRVVARAPAATPDGAAEDLVGALEAAIVPPPAAPRRAGAGLRLDLGPTAAYVASLGTGPQWGVSLGVQVPMAPRLVIAGHAGVVSPLAVPLVDPTGLAGGMAPGSIELPAAIDARWLAWKDPRARLALWAGIAARLGVFARPVLLNSPVSPIAFDPRPGTTPSTMLVAFGPTVGATVAVVLWGHGELYATVRYEANWAAVTPAISASRRLRTAPIGSGESVDLAPDTRWRNLVALDLGLALRLE